MTQVNFLRRNFDIISLDDALKSYNRPSNRPRVVLTFDDGDAGLYEYLLPFLRKEMIPVTVYVATQQIEQQQPYWFDRVINALQGEHDVSLAGVGNWSVPNRNGKDRWEVIGDMLESLKRLDAEDRERLASKIVDLGSPPATKNFLRPMTKAQLSELASLPNVTIGAHSHGHELLDRIPPQAASDSMMNSKLLLETWTSCEIAHFAFPNGNYSNDLSKEARQLGFRSASILEPKSRLDDPTDLAFALPRIPIGSYDTLQRFKLRLLGI